MAEALALRLEGLYSKKFPITVTDAIATAGSCFAQGMYVESNVRSARPEGVEAVMGTFFRAHAPDADTSSNVRGGAPTTIVDTQRDEPRDGSAREEVVLCEDALLEAISRE